MNNQENSSNEEVSLRTFFDLFATFRLRYEHMYENNYDAWILQQTGREEDRKRAIEICKQVQRGMSVLGQEMDRLSTRTIVE